MRARIGVVLLALAVVVVGLTLAGRLGHAPARKPAAAPAAARQHQPCQTSDCEPGEVAEPVNPYAVDRPQISHVTEWKVAPGIHFKRWTREDRRGQQKLFLASINPSKPGVSLQYGAPRYVPDRGTVLHLVKRTHGLVGVNGGFFDISDTGAPLGVGVDRKRGFLHAAEYTWNNAFYVSGDGRPHIGPLHLTAHIDEYPQLGITNYNSPRVRAGRIGIYTPRWGRTSGFSITDGQRSDVRMVVIQSNRVVANRAGVTDDLPIDSTVLVGRSRGADDLAKLPIGSSATVSWGLQEQPALAISGETTLLRDGQVMARDDSILHPRTSVGFDRDTGKVYLLCVDGRTTKSRGATMVEMAQLMRSVGATDALNFDGGGSSTMVAPGRGGDVKVQNYPSDGHPRHVGDALVVRYKAP